MSRPKRATPARRYHISGQSVVTIDGIDIYLGPHDSHVTMARYAVLIAQYQANGLSLPKDFSREDLFARASAFLATQMPVMVAEEQARAPMTVQHLCEEWKRHTAIKYKHNPQEMAREVKMANDITKLYGGLLVDSFGPVKLRQWRDTLIQPQRRDDHDEKDRSRWPEKLSRRYINRLVNNVVKMFRHGVSVEMVQPDTLTKLETLEPLRAGQSEAKELPKVVPVDISHVRATAAHLSPIIKAMLRVQIATGMRPKEVCLMRPCDIDRSGETWIYRPEDHKTAWRGKTKAVPLAEDAREAITDYLNRDPKAYCFSPAEAMAWRRAVGSAKRTTPMNEGNRTGTNRKENPKRSPRDHYDTQSYRQALQRAADVAKVPRWHPYQLRHLTATLIRDALTIEHSQAMLGHSHVSMTEHYAALAESKAIEASKAAPKL